jgi:hypothetical protein
MNKQKLTVSEAIELSGVARSTFYNKYIKEGYISKSKDSKGNAYIDYGELCRVFDIKQDETPVGTNENTLLEQEIALLKQQLQYKNEQIEHYKLLEKKSLQREEHLQKTIEHYQRALTHQPTQHSTQNTKTKKEIAIERIKRFRKGSEPLNQTLERLKKLRRGNETDYQLVDRLWSAQNSKQDR